MVEADYVSSRERYELVLWDGFVQPVLLRHRRYVSRNGPHERLMAELLYHWGKKVNVPDRPNKPVHRSEPMHIWVVGDDDWIANQPELFRNIRGPAQPPTPAHWDESRLIITGYGPTVPPGGPWGAPWNKLRLKLGMYRMQHHSNRNDYRFHARLLLKPMHEAFLRTRAPPPPILHQFRVPYEFFGDA